ncbi:uncharacterized protein N7458_009419 [Penicillium daleae]|uniref:Uncharacterized protein n=1 Tax=Penicillium daleae TaxID=63821 RepID=A0AAD6BWY6_9EURO|nr:uncharacterized protein N7458_009419 [Penicillium daleae]KAJ5438421.1 hypothetical protein N7458_009419 [Penicillium daleae]
MGLAHLEANNQVQPNQDAGGSDRDEPIAEDEPACGVAEEARIHTAVARSVRQITHTENPPWLHP